MLLYVNFAGFISIGNTYSSLTNFLIYEKFLGSYQLLIV